jgi:hypothetical protein
MDNLWAWQLSANDPMGLFVFLAWACALYVYFVIHKGKWQLNWATMVGILCGAAAATLLSASYIPHYGVAVGLPCAFAFGLLFRFVLGEMV